MQRAPEPALLLGARHMLQHVVYGHYVGAGQKSRDREQVRDVDEVTIKAPQDSAKLAVTLDRPFRFQKGDSVKVWRQRPDFFHLRRRADQKVFILTIQFA